MAKGGKYSGVFGKAKADLHALHLANADDLKGDFNYTQDQLGAIFGNLQTSGRGIASTMTATQSRQLAKMQAVAARGQRQTKRLVSGGAAEARNLFGSGIGQVIDAQFTQARGTAKATAKESAGLVKSGVTTAKGGQLALQAQQAGASEAASGASYALATALKYRAGQDADAEAQQKLAIDTMKLQSKLQWEEFRKEQDYAAQKALDAQDQANSTLFSQAAPLVGSGASDLQAYITEHPDDASLKDALASLELDPNDPGTPAASAILGRAYKYMTDSGMDQEMAVQTAFSDLYGTLPGYDATTMNSVLSKSNTAATTNKFIDEIAPLMKGGLSSDVGLGSPIPGNAMALGFQHADERTQVYDIAAKYGYNDTQVLDLLNQYFPSRTPTSSGAIPGVYGVGASSPAAPTGTGRGGTLST
jgi:hypothetical protein